MKRYISIIVAVLAMFSALPVSAQQTQDALYIYRNDGGFNGFFFADIDRIEYSKIDTLGVEQADYVVQEVYALDSVFRIPISAHGRPYRRLSRISTAPSTLESLY